MAPAPEASAASALRGLVLEWSGPAAEYDLQILAVNLDKELVTVNGLYAQRTDVDHV
ncbi:MAG: hypothetical protein N3I86_05140 [Verrucomicrobiae bacterium]|nr:hypothetical protein [Verrucomicrobiae bacterium]